MTPQAFEGRRDGSTSPKRGIGMSHSQSRANEKYSLKSQRKTRQIYFQKSYFLNMQIIQDTSKIEQAVHPHVLFDSGVWGCRDRVQSG